MCMEKNVDLKLLPQRKLPMNLKSTTNPLKGQHDIMGCKFREGKCRGRCSKEESNNIISSFDDDIWRVQTLHDNAVIVSAMIANYDIR